MRQINLRQQLKAATVIAFMLFSACVFNGCNDTSTKSTGTTDSTAVHVTDSTNMQMNKNKMMSDTPANPIDTTTKGGQLPPPR